MLQEDFSASFTFEAKAARGTRLHIYVPRGTTFKVAGKAPRKVRRGEVLGDREGVAARSLDAVTPAAQAEAAAAAREWAGQVRAPVDGVFRVEAGTPMITSSGVDVRVPLTSLQELRLRGWRYTGTATVETPYGMRTVECRATWLEPGLVGAGASGASPVSAQAVGDTRIEVVALRRGHAQREGSGLDDPGKADGASVPSTDAATHESAESTVSPSPASTTTPVDAVTATVSSEPERLATVTVTHPTSPEPAVTVTSTVTHTAVAVETVTAPAPPSAEPKPEPPHATPVDSAPGQPLELVCRLPGWVDTAAGMGAKVKVTTRTQAKALLAPAVAIAYDDRDQAYVTVTSGEKPRKVLVELGVTDGVLRVVRGKLTPGEVLQRAEGS